MATNTKSPCSSYYDLDQKQSTLFIITIQRIKDEAQVWVLAEAKHLGSLMMRE